MLTRDPPPGVCAWLKNCDQIDHLEARTWCCLGIPLSVQPRLLNDVIVDWVCKLMSCCLLTEIQGPLGTPYETGLFKLDITIPSRWCVYSVWCHRVDRLTRLPQGTRLNRRKCGSSHPYTTRTLITAGGSAWTRSKCNQRCVCGEYLVQVVDTKTMLQQGSWLPSVNISTLLTTIRLLMAEPNADDGLMPDIVRLQRDIFNTHATRTHIFSSHIAVRRPTCTKRTGLLSIRWPKCHAWPMQQTSSISAKWAVAARTRI